MWLMPTIRPAQPRDLPAITDIYNEAGVGTTNPHWEALLQEGTHNLHATPDFAQKRSAWRALRLERTTRAQSVAPRLAGKVRM